MEASWVSECINWAFRREQRPNRAYLQIPFRSLQLLSAAFRFFQVSDLSKNTGTLRKGRSSRCDERPEQMWCIDPGFDHLTWRTSSCGGTGALCQGCALGVERERIGIILYLVPLGQASAKLLWSMILLSMFS